MTLRPAKLALADGTIYTGRAAGAPVEVLGEVVFNTSLTGYQEVLTDPSYRGQIVVMTYPHQGNYGTTAEDQESIEIQPAGFVARDLTTVPSNYRSHRDLETYLRAGNVPAIVGIDTRALVRQLRSAGSMMGVLSSVDLEDASLVRKAATAPGMTGRDLVREVVPTQAYEWNQRFGALAEHVLPSRPADKHVVAVDYGMKWNILRCLTQIGCRVTVVPGTATAAEILAYQPDGVFLSNGPGDPAAVDYAIRAVRDLLGQKPIFGICLGHQLLGLALGGRTFKLKFGHRGINQPVRNELTKRVEITSQNHGFAVDPDSLPPEVQVSHINLNDGTVEGLQHRTLPVFSVQYHPEAAAGPHDSGYLFEQFRNFMS
jgi:carbamoyl-phosphate synthase small subunit